jgi:hypothetical protein
MSIDPNKAFGMKATNKSYTLSFEKDIRVGLTNLNATDLESPKMSFRERLSIAWAILRGANVGDFVFPLYLRNSDLYHMSYVHRPEKEKAVAPSEPKEEKVATMKPAAPKKPKSTAPKKPRKPRAPKAAPTTPKTEA